MQLDFIMNQLSNGIIYLAQLLAIIFQLYYLFSSMVTNAVELQGHLDGEESSGSNGELGDM